MDEQEGTASVRPPSEEHEEQKKQRHLRQKKEELEGETSTGERAMGKGAWCGRLCVCVCV